MNQLEELLNSVKATQQAILDKFNHKVAESQKRSEKNNEKYLDTLKKERELLLDKMNHNDKQMASKLEVNENRLKVIMEENQKSINLSLSFLDETITKRDQEMINRFSNIEEKMGNILDSEYHGGRDLGDNGYGRGIGGSDDDGGKDDFDNADVKSDFY